MITYKEKNMLLHGTFNVEKEGAKKVMFVLDKSGHLYELRGESTSALNWTQGSTWFRYFALLLQNLQLVPN